jgi:putative SOS response-associated peptidase YedK
MCGRFTLTDPGPARIRARFGLDEPAALSEEEQPRYNIAPTDPVLAVRRSGDRERELGRLRWGLLPGRWAERRSGAPLINARAETLERQPAFAESFRERRCLIPADGFYEWRHDESGKTPFWISRDDGELFAFAGIWAALPERDGAGELHSCAIVTCEPNGLIRPLHDRMPVVLARGAEARWLEPDAGAEELASLLAPAPEDLLVLREVVDTVNDVREDGPHLLERRQAQPQLF